MTGLRIGELFSGYGGLGMGVQAALGGTVAWHSEIDPGASKILAHRYPDVPNLGDISAVDWTQVEPVDVLCGGFPCQDVSAAGKRAGIREGTRSGLWSEFDRAIDALRPSLVIIENVRGLLSAAAEHPAHGDLEPCPWCLGDDEPVTLRALGAVLGDLADLGFDARWHGLRAADVGAPHGRYRVFVVAWPAADADDLGRPTEGTGRPGPELTAAPRDRRDAAADAERGRRDGRPGELRPGRRAEPAHRGHAAADASGWELQRRGEPDLLGNPQTAEQGEGHQRQRPRHPARDRRAVDWGPYAAAIHRWEAVLGRPAPAPTEPGAKGQPRLSAHFVEWLMGLPAGWVCDVPGLGRNQQLKALGNGVVPQQAAAALRLLLPATAAPPTPAETEGAA